MLFAFAASIFRGTCLVKPAATYAALLLAAVCSCASLSPPACANEPIDLRPQPRSGTTQVRALIASEGKLKLNADGQEVKHVAVKADAELTYVERLLEQRNHSSDFRAGRLYQTAQARLTLNGSEVENKLRPERQLIIVESNAQHGQLFSPRGPLTREEIELVNVPASEIVPEALLPEKRIAVGDDWKLVDTTAARLLGFDLVSEQDLVCTLDSVKDEVAVISLKGKVAGAVEGVSSDVELKGKLNFDLRKRSISWLTLAFRENRAIGHAQPGFEVLTTVRMVFGPSTSQELSDAVLAKEKLRSDSALTRVELRSELGGFTIMHDRRWRVMVERGDLTVLRLIDRGDLIAQCNITPRPPLDNRETVTIEAFQDDVRRVLGKNAEQIVEAGEEHGEGRQILRVVVAGKVGDVPIQWTYYHVAEAGGRRASLVFTIESSLLERFASIDRDLLDSFQFLSENDPLPAAARKPTDEPRHSEIPRGGVWR
jgi:hypothetical protein